jgi:hypothetical protein
MNISVALCYAVTELSKKYARLSKLFFGKVELRTAKYKTNIYLELSPLNMEFIDRASKKVQIGGNEDGMSRCGKKVLEQKGASVN